MIQRSALPSINGKGDAQDVRPTSSTAVGGRRALGMIPKSAGAASVVRHTRHSEIAVTSSWPPHENQAQRPSSTNVASRGVSAERMAIRIFASEHDSHQQQNSRYKEPENDSRDKVQQLRDENAIFRHENDLLRSKLVEKMRGQSKVVAGGQFRATVASTVKVPVVPISGCTKCSTARMKSIKAHQETEQAQATIAELQNYVDKIEAAQQRLWEERSTFVNEIAQLRDELAEKVEECVLIEAECTKLDKQVNVLQPKNDFAEYLTQQPVGKEVVDNAIQCSLQESFDDEIKADVASLKAEVQLVMQQLDEREQELKKVSKEVDRAQQSTKLEKEQREQEARLWNEDSTEHKRRILELEQTEKKLRVYIQDLQRSHQKDVQIIEKANQQLREDIVAKEAEIQTLSQDKLESSAREQKQKMIVKELKVRNEQKVADVDRLHAVVAVEKSANVALKNQIRDLEEQVETLIKENTELSASTFLQQQEPVDHVRNESDKLLSKGQAEQHRLTEALNAAEKDNRSLQARISEVEAELAEHDELMQRQKQSHTRAMERLLESSLRLCVVAPTVNVQLNTNGANILNKPSNTSIEKVTQDNDSDELTSVICRSAPQQDSIKQVIENDVLPLFTSVFLQGDDNASPQADVPMTHWLQDLLHDMQARIATQLESIYSTAPVKPSE